MSAPEEEADAIRLACLQGEVAKAIDEIAHLKDQKARLTLERALEASEATKPPYIEVTQADRDRAEEWRFLLDQRGEYEGDAVEDLAIDFAAHRIGDD